MLLMGSPCWPSDGDRQSGLGPMAHVSPSLSFQPLLPPLRCLLCWALRLSLGLLDVRGLFHLQLHPNETVTLVPAWGTAVTDVCPTMVSFLPTTSFHLHNGEALLESLWPDDKGTQQATWADVPFRWKRQVCMHYHCPWVVVMSRPWGTSCIKVSPYIPNVESLGSSEGLMIRRLLDFQSSCSRKSCTIRNVFASTFSTPWHHIPTQAHRDLYLITKRRRSHACHSLTHNIHGRLTLSEFRQEARDLYKEANPSNLKK